MQRKLVKDDKTILYTIKSRKGVRGIRISVNSLLEVIVTKPKYVPSIYIESMMKGKFDWIQEKINEFSKKPKKLLSHFSAKDFKENKHRAYALAHNRVLHFNQYYKYEIKNITIRNQKTRWGSCSGKKNLSFNYKIIFLPPPLQDYLIVHELCHLMEMNHGKRFWSLVSQQIPNHVIIRKQMKLY